MNPDRLAELHRQRAIVRDHLTWLENEISAATGAPPSEIALSRPSARPPDTRFLPSAAEPAPGEPNPAAAAAAAKRGCLAAAAVVLILAAIALTAVYLVRYRDRPLIFMSHDEPGSSR